jgi:hypothetical protein
MNENDLRDCFAMFAMLRFAEAVDMDRTARLCYEYADRMLEARKQKEKDDEEDVGIARVVPKRNYRRKS